MKNLLTTLLFISAFILILKIEPTIAAGGLNCTVADTCPTGFTRLLGLENESAGGNNSHVQNISLSTYNYSVCCNSTISGRTLGSSCPTGTSFLLLNNITNAHVQQTQIATYTVPVCISANIGTPVCTYSQGCDAGKECLLSMASSEGDNTTNAHVGSCSAYSTDVCCSLNNTAPTNVTLWQPINETQTINRTPLFNWTIASDPDGDSITYRIQVALESSFSTIVIDQETSATNFTPTSNLAFDTFFWRVYSNDSVASNVSTTENFTVITSLVLTLVNSSINFQNMAPNENNDTADDKPIPFLLRNDGNVEANVSINATAMFSSVSLGTLYYRYKADNSTETNSFHDGLSTTAYANMPASPVTFLRILNHTNTNDTAEIDIDVTVPNAERGGIKNSTVQLTGVVA